jgi:hypothetical protein
MRLPGLGLRDYAEPTELLFKSGRYEAVWRQKAASTARYILIAFELAAFYLWLLERLPSPETQRTLKRIGRNYKNSCYWSEKEKRSLFDRCTGHRDAQKLDPRKQENVAAAVAADAELSNREIALELGVGVSTVREARKSTGGAIVHLEGSAKRHTRLVSTRSTYNEQWASYQNSAGLSKTLRQQRSLNIPRETIEARNNMIAILEQKFSLRDETMAA